MRCDNQFSSAGIGRLTWHLEGAAGVRAGGRVREGAAAAPRGVGVAAAGGMRERVTVGLWEGVREGGVEGHVWLILAQVPELG